MRWITFTVLSLILSFGSFAREAAPLCVSDPAKMPATWQPSPELQKTLNPAPWSKSEAKDAEHAERAGIEEMINYFKSTPSAVHKMFDDAVAALLQVTYSGANESEFNAKVVAAARDNLTTLIAPYLDADPDAASCKEFEDLLPLSIFAHRLFPAGDRRTDVVTKRVNAAYEACGSLNAATDDVLSKVEEDNKDPSLYLDHLEDLFDLYAWALLLIEAELYPDIELPDQAREFGETAWDDLDSLPLRGASEFEKGIKDERFITLGDLATHLTHIPTGLGRYPIYVSDKPDLYRFLRENLYPMLQSGDRDLFSLYVDTLRQYGCTPQNDKQVRDGTRYLLKDFHDRGDRWMNYHEKRKTLSDPIEYINVHHVWTAVLGVRDRKLEPPKPGGYSSIVRRWLPPEDQNN